MRRVPELRPEAMSPEQGAVAQEIASGPHGQIVGPFPAWLHSPELAKRARALSEFIRFKSSVPPRLMELAILVAGRFWKAEFEVYAHAKLARKAGLEANIVDALAAGQHPPLSRADDLAVYGLCTELLESNRVCDATYTRAVTVLGIRQVVELVATIGYYSMVSLTLNTFRVPLPEGEPSPFRHG